MDPDPPKKLASKIPIASMAIQKVSSSSSSSSAPRWNYDVFLSFRGEDTRKNFTSHLYHALRQKGVKTFIDDEELRRGEEIPPALLEAIEQSKISIIVFSKNYATSTWCLDELVKILECRKSIGQMVRPLFYDVDPSEVRKQEGSFGEAIAMHEEKFRDNMQRVKSWRVALTEAANLSGWHLSNGHEYDLIQRIVKEISSKLNCTFLDVAKNPVGLHSHIQAMSTLLSVGCDNVRMVGVHGIGGIGKTTVAKAVYNLIATQFESSSFLANVREISNQYGLVQLQETLLSEILGDANLKVGNVDRGINVIRDRLCHKKVLLVLDDVNKLGQLEKLAGDKSWFGPGSRIIITTRDQHVLDAHGVETTYEVAELSRDDALQLFCWNAFKKSCPAKGYEELTNCVVEYAKGLPLVLVVLGSFLYGRSEPEWKSTISKLQRSLDKEVYEILKISFDGLEAHEKALFLDIACFFNGEDRDYGTEFWEACDFDPVIGIQVLIEKSLIKVEYNKLQMHDLLQLMGRNIVYQESPNEPGKRSRLWSHEDILHVLIENSGTNAVQGIKLNLLGQEDIFLNSKAFTKMKRLRLLIVHNALFSEGPKNLSNELRLLDWRGYPSSSLPSNFCPKKLVTLNMRESKIKQLEGIKVFENLKDVDFRKCEYLTCIPDLSMMANLELLSLDDCQNLIEVHQSVGFLHKLAYLSLEYCSNLRHLPSSLKLPSLQRLFLAGCKRLEKFPNIVGEMAHLDAIFLNETAIKELPSSVENLIGLEVIVLRNCKNLIDLPSSISKLPCLGYLDLDGCSNLGKFPKSCSRNDELSPCLGWLASSNQNKTQDLSLCVNRSTPFEFPALIKLGLSDCNLSEVDFLATLDCFSTLEELRLSGNNFVSLPACISKFTKLKVLALENCEELPQMNANVGKSLIDNLASSERFCGESVMNFSFPGSDLPEWFCHHTTKSFLFFQVPSYLYAKIAGFVFGFVLGAAALPGLERRIYISLNGRRLYSFIRPFQSLNPDHVCLIYVPRKDLKCMDELLSKEQWTLLKFSFQILPGYVPGNPLLDFAWFREIELQTKESLKKCGIQLVFEQDEKANDPRGTRHYSPTWDKARLTKRRLEDYNSDDHLENNYCQRQKRHCCEGVASASFYQGRIMYEDIVKIFDLIKL